MCSKTRKSVSWHCLTREQVSSVACIIEDSQFLRLFGLPSVALLRRERMKNVSPLRGVQSWRREEHFGKYFQTTVALPL